MRLSAPVELASLFDNFLNKFGVSDIQVELEKLVEEEFGKDGALKYPEELYNTNTHEESRALIILGPSSSGKSYALSEFNKDLADFSEHAVTLDGGVVREKSKTWQKMVKWCNDNHVDQIDGFFNQFFKPATKHVKKKMMDKAMKVDLIENGAMKGETMKLTNLAIPSTASNIENDIKTLNKLKQNGYTIEIYAIYTKKETCGEWGRKRATKEKKTYEDKNWEKSIESIFKIADWMKNNDLDPSDMKIIHNVVGETPKKLSLEDLKKQVLEDLSKSIALQTYLTNYGNKNE